MAAASPTAAPFVPESRALPVLRDAAQSCRGCPLYKFATQAVFGEGTHAARVMIVGEQPGDAEDLAGRPFVGPAGKLLDDALAAAGIPREATYITNAVKHFKFTPRGKKRIHSKPSRTEVVACRPWLEAELEAIAPDILVLLGATAAQAVLGASFRVTQHRGEAMTGPHARVVFATVHPSSVLRTPSDEPGAREAARAAFFADVAAVGAAYRARATRAAS